MIRLIFRVNDQAFHDAWRMDYDEWRKKHKGNIEEITYREYKEKYSLDARKDKKTRPRHIK